MNIHNVRIYRIQIYGQVKEEDINRSSPLQFKIEQDEEDNTFVLARSDQSGLIGLIRHLHGLGLVLVSMSSGNEDLFDPCSEAPGNEGGNTGESNSLWQLYEGPYKTLTLISQRNRKEEKK